MGIQGLIPMLKDIHNHIHIEEWRGKTLAVDSYVWLHKGCYGHADALALGHKTDRYINYAMQQIRLLRHFGVEPYLVFDGGMLPSKDGTEVDRAARRADALAKGKECLAMGQRSQARDHFVKAIDVTPAMAYQLIKALKREKVKYVVAPYEADPQLAYLEKIGVVDGVITEDSDLLVFGCKAVLFKLDSDGRCCQVLRKDFAHCREYAFVGWTNDEFRAMAILSGCDYLDSIHGLGLKTAYKLMRKYRNPKKVIQSVRLEGTLTVPRTYEKEFRRAELTFLHQRVFDPRTNKIVHFEPLPAGLDPEDLSFIGAALDEDYAIGVATGEIDPITKQKMIDIHPEPREGTTSTALTVKSTNTTQGGSRASTSAAGPAVKNSIFNYFRRTAAPVASTSAVGTSKVAVKAAAKITLIEAPKTAQSKFFGASTGPVCVDSDSDDEVTVVESSGSRLSGKGKEKAKEEPVELEMEPELQPEMDEEERVPDSDEELALYETHNLLEAQGFAAESSFPRASTPPRLTQPNADDSREYQPAPWMVASDPHKRAFSSPSVFLTSPTSSAGMWLKKEVEEDEGAPESAVADEESTMEVLVKTEIVVKQEGGMKRPRAPSTASVEWIDSSPAAAFGASSGGTAGLAEMRQSGDGRVAFQSSPTIFSEADEDDEAPPRQKPRLMLDQEKDVKPKKGIAAPSKGSKKALKAALSATLAKSVEEDEEQEPEVKAKVAAITSGWAAKFSFKDPGGRHKRSAAAPSVPAAKKKAPRQVDVKAPLPSSSSRPPLSPKTNQPSFQPMNNKKRRRSSDSEDRQDEIEDDRHDSGTFEAISPVRPVKKPSQKAPPQQKSGPLASSSPLTALPSSGLSEKTASRLQRFAFTGPPAASQFKL